MEKKGQNQRRNTTVMDLQKAPVTDNSTWKKKGLCVDLNVE